MRFVFNAAFAGVLSLLSCLAAVSASAQGGPSPAPAATVSVRPLAAVAATPSFDPLKATNAYLATVKGAARAKSDSYFEGGYVLTLVDAIYGVVVLSLLLWLRISAAIRNFAQRTTRSRFLQVPIYAVLYTVVVTVATFPLTVYEDFLREHAYGLSNMNLGQWLVEFLTDSGVNLIAFTLLATVIYGVIRRSKQYWWVWGAIVTVIFLAIGNVIYPVFIAPLTNDYYPLKDGPVKQQILSLARSEGIPVNNVYEFNASKQSKRISANVSGFMGTTRISMTDNLIIRCNPREIKAVLGHEMGHYVLDHNLIGLTWIGLLFFAGFVFANWGFRQLTGIFGGNWDVRTIDDPAGLPVLMLLATLFFLVATPIQNTITRTLEQQADMFGINAAREPDGFATAVLKLSEYRKLDPSPWEEFVFYDHPSGRTRIWSMMRWKAQHLNDPDIKAGPVSPQ